MWVYGQLVLQITLVVARFVSLKAWKKYILGMEYSTRNGTLSEMPVEWIEISTLCNTVPWQIEAMLIIFLNMKIASMKERQFLVKRE